MSVLHSPFFGRPFNWRVLSEAIWRIEHGFERARAEGRPADDVRVRMVLILTLFAAGFAALTVGAAKTALFPQADKAGTVSGMPAGSRADLVDRNGQLLALDLPTYNLYVERRHKDETLIFDTAETRRRLAPFLSSVARVRLEQALASGRRTKLFGPMSQDQKAQIEDLGLPGVSFEVQPKRDYPLGQTAAHLIGFSDTGGTGIAGAEYALDKTIKSSADPVPLALDLRVQAALQDELEKAKARFNAAGGAGIVVDVHTGEILGMASAPGFDPNAPGAWADFNRKNNVAAQVYEAGSVFKVFTLTTGLDSGVVTQASTFDVSHPLVIGNSKPIHDYDQGKEPLTLTLPQVFIYSSNIGASRIAMALGGQRIDQYMKAFGLYNAAPSELAESTRPLLPHRDTHGQLTDITMAQMSFGQGISVTPLQIATGMSAIFNGGNYIPLTIKKRLPGEVPASHRIISEQTSRAMLDIMRMNVTDPKGSGRKADVPGYSVGGKTGTAQKAKDGHYLANTRVASFAAVFPTSGALSDKRYLIYVLLDEPHAAEGTSGFATAGFVAAPTAGNIINRIAPFLGVARTAPAATPAQTAAAAAPPSAAMIED
jgi:cell division protein FtsI (penicillin-binding protein 3)